MPGYPGAGKAGLLYENQQAFFWNGESPVSGAASIAFQLNRTRGGAYPWGWSVEIAFGGAPGTIAVAVQVADSDTPNNYVTIGTISAVNANNVGRFDNVTTTWGKNVRLLLTTLTNVVTTTATITH